MYTSLKLLPGRKYIVYFSFTYLLSKFGLKDRHDMFEDFYKNKYEIFSAGLAPMTSPNMDPRSSKFLESNGIYNVLHTPKKINSKMLNYFDRFLAVDFFVLNQLNNLYPKYRGKFHSLTAQLSNINIIDPYEFEDDDYFKVMDDIKYVAEKINLEEI